MKITASMWKGIGRWSDAQLARHLRDPMRDADTREHLIAEALARLLTRKETINA